MKNSTTIVIIVIFALAAVAVVAWAKFGTPRQPSNTTNVSSPTLELEVPADRQQLKLTPMTNNNGAVTIGAPGEQATITVHVKNASDKTVDNLSVDIATDERASLIVGMTERLEAGPNPNSFIWKLSSLESGEERTYSFTVAITYSPTDRLIFTATARSGATVLTEARSSTIAIIQ